MQRFHPREHPALISHKLLCGKPAATARRICFSAALYADIQERLYRQQWMYAYSDCMLRLYDRIRQYPEVLAALIQLH